MGWTSMLGGVWVRWLGVVLLGLLIGVVSLARGPQDIVGLQELPVEARQVLRQIHEGGPFRHARDGVVFFNREQLLPRQSRGYYTEYTVPTPGARNRGARRIVAGKGTTGDPATSGEYWYTADHYASFRRIRE